MRQDLGGAPAPETVVSKGKFVAREGPATAGGDVVPLPQDLLHTIRFPKPIQDADFAVRGGNGSKRILVRIVELIDNTITRERREELVVEDGVIQSDPAGDILKIAILERHAGDGKSFTAFVRGFGLKSGAFASSYSHENRSPLTVVGASEKDMALAVNRLAQLGGGLIVCDGGKVVEEFPLPIMGLLCNLSLEETMEKIKGIEEAVAGLGCALPNPILTLQMLPTSRMPFFRVGLKGLVDVKTGNILDLVIRQGPERFNQEGQVI